MLGSRLARVVVAAALAWAGGAAAGAPARSYDDARLPDGADAWPLEPGPALVIDNVRVNGVGPLRFMLDTGTTGGVRLDPALAARLGLEPTGATRTGARRPGSGPTLPTYDVAELHVGATRWWGVYGAARELNPPGVPDEARIDGVLGWHLFNAWTLTIDPEAREVRVSDDPLPRPGTEGVLAMRGDRDGPTAPLVCGRVRVNALLDTGSMAGLLVHPRVAARLTLEGEPRPLGAVATVDGAREAAAARLGEPATLAGAPLPGWVWVTEAISPANAGLGVIGAWRVEIDGANSRVRLTPPGVDAPEVGPGEGADDASGGVGAGEERAVDPPEEGVDAPQGFDDDG